MQNTLKYALSATVVAMLVACGGGGDDNGTANSQPVDPASPIAKYTGSYSYCDQDHSKYTIVFSQAGSNVLRADFSDVTYQNTNCTGPVLGTYILNGTLLNYLSTGVGTVSSGGILPASLTFDKFQARFSNLTPILTGPAVINNCVRISSAKQFCFDVLTLNQTLQAGFLLDGSILYELPLENGVYELDGIYRKN